MSASLYISRIYHDAVNDPNAAPIGCGDVTDAYRELVRREHRAARFAMVNDHVRDRLRFYCRHTPTGQWQRVNSGEEWDAARALSEFLAPERR